MSAIRNFDVGLVIAVVLLITFGLTAIYSATYVGEKQTEFTKQLLWAVLGLVVLTAVVVTPLKSYYKNAYLLYGLSVILLVVVLFVGKGAGTRRWIALGPAWIQPAEFAKIGTLLALSRYLSNEHRKLDNLRELTVAFAIAFVPLALVMKQPDLGSALVFLALILPVLHWAGLSPAILFVLLAPLASLLSAFNYYSFLIVMILLSVTFLLCQRGLTFFLVNFIINIGVGILTPIVWNLLKEYQKNRILTFLGLVRDPHGLGYQVIQSKVAIGSGGLLGKGFLDGTQTHLRFLPEQHTDFIFCVIGEEFGFIGVFLVLALFFYLVVKGIRISTSVKSKFSSVVVFGATIIFLFQIFVNIGMTVGIMPVTGLPLPFLSYGGSSLLANLILVGLILNASRKRFEYL
ncbi:rod shape-determining protein RodA [candidate division KSB1 bacterium]|nr:rod shape-determining protein RodA [candidate division KSB1 bacterium]